MDLRIILKKRVVRVLLVLVVIGGASAAYLGDFFHGHGNWTVFEPNQITLVDVEGNRVSIQGDYRMEQMTINSFEAWLESYGFSREKAEKGSPETVSFRGEYKGSLSITVTIESKATPETASVALSYRGSDFKRFYAKRQRLVGIFSNEVLKQCTKEVF